MDGCPSTSSCLMRVASACCSIVSMNRLTVLNTYSFCLIVYECKDVTVFREHGHDRLQRTMFSPVF